MRKIEETRHEEARDKRGEIKSDGNVINLSIRTIPKHNILSGFKARVVGAEDFKVLSFFLFCSFYFTYFFNCFYFFTYFYFFIFISFYLLFLLFSINMYSEPLGNSIASSRSRGSSWRWLFKGVHRRSE